MMRDEFLLIVFARRTRRDENLIQLFLLVCGAADEVMMRKNPGESSGRVREIFRAGVLNRRANLRV